MAALWRFVLLAGTARAVAADNSFFSDKNALVIAVDAWTDNATAANEKYGPIGQWNTSNVTDMIRLFNGKSDFDADISQWQTSQVTRMTEMFEEAKAFNQKLNGWNTSQVARMLGMFRNTKAFNQPLDRWDTSQVVHMSFMFGGAEAFNQPLDGWDTSRVESMSYMFQNATAFNQKLNWNTSSLDSYSTIDMFLDSGMKNCSKLHIANNGTNGNHWQTQPAEAAAHNWKNLTCADTAPDSGLGTAAVAGIATGAVVIVVATAAAVYIYQPFEILAAAPKLSQPLLQY